MSQRTRMCVICKQMIDPERAEAMPSTLLCSTHGEAIERFGGEFRVLSAQENLSKPGSLKRNPGGVRTKMIRNDRTLDQLREAFDRKRSEC